MPCGHLPVEIDEERIGRAALVRQVRHPDGIVVARTSRRPPSRAWRRRQLVAGHVAVAARCRDLLDQSGHTQSLQKSCWMIASVSGTFSSAAEVGERGRAAEELRRNRSATER